MSELLQNRGVFYHRDSGGQAEMTPGRYVEWAQGEAKRYNVSFSGTPQLIEQMIKHERCHDGDICLDYIVSGNKLSREGLSALQREAARPEVTHLFFAARDRIARPDYATDGIRLENELRAQGCTLVFPDRVIQPLQQGKRADLGEMIGALCEYDQAGAFRFNHSGKMIHAQIALAKKGCSTGGRAPYGFRRWLVNDRGDALRELLDGEVIRMQGHHVVWLPTAQEEVDVIRRIFSLLSTMPARRVAAQLTSEGVPTPNYGRRRTDHGVSHATSGIWHPNTVTNIARNSLCVGIKRYGRRSIGDQQRFSADGPRALKQEEFRSRGSNEVRITVNADDDCIHTRTAITPLVDQEERQALVAELDRRGKSQRGKPRSQGEHVNPLGCRVFDMNCGWPMYRLPDGKSYSYKCGQYQQSSGKACHSNRVQGPLLTSFVLQTIRQRLFSAESLQELEAKLLELAKAEATNEHNEERKSKEIKAKLKSVANESSLMEHNLARATSDLQYQTIAKQLEAAERSKQALLDELKKVEAKASRRVSHEQEVAAIMANLRSLASLATSDVGQAAAQKLIAAVDAKVFLAFVSVTPKKRTIQKISHGVITFGDAPLPIERYNGPTARTRLDVGRKASASSSNPLSFGEQEKSVGNVSRAERI